MLIINDGRWFGSISGGCSEGGALRKALQLMNDREPMTVIMIREKSNQNLGISLGSNGEIDVLIEPILEGNNPLNLFSSFVSLIKPVELASGLSLTTSTFKNYY